MKKITVEVVLPVRVHAVVEGELKRVRKNRVTLVFHQYGNTDEQALASVVRRLEIALGVEKAEFWMEETPK